MGEGVARTQPFTLSGLVTTVAWDDEAVGFDAGEAVIRPTAKEAPATRTVNATTGMITRQVRRRNAGGGVKGATGWSDGVVSVMLRR
jgi:hypothetical protein